MPLPSDDGRRATPARRGYSEEARDAAETKPVENQPGDAYGHARRGADPAAPRSTGGAQRVQRDAYLGGEPQSEAPGYDDLAAGAAKRAGGTYGATGTPPAPPPSEQAAAPKPDRRFRGAIIRTVGSTVIPGLGMLGTRAHRLGVLLLTAIVAAAVVLGVVVLRNPLLAAGNALQTGWMRTIAFALIAVAAIWVAVIIGTYLISRPRRMTSKQRTIGGVAVGLLTFIVSAPLAVASAYSFETARLSNDLFGSENDSQSQTRPTLEKSDPWADKDRVNILLAGGDSGEGREADLGVRTDTMMMASIDTKTGATLLIQLPRNLQYPIFAADSPLASVFPYGFDDGADAFLSSVWQDAPTMYPELFENTDYPGADALKWAFEGVTGQKADYFVLVNIDGLVNLIDAMGGVTVNVNYPIAKGGSTSDYNCGESGWIPEGPSQLLNGTDAMWYARSRCNSPGGDFGRMQRQSCLVQAVIDQADPATMLTRYEDIAQAAGDMVSTDIPQEHLSAIVDLAGRVQRSGVVNRISFVDDGTGWYSSAYPDFDRMQEEISAAITTTQEQAEAKNASQSAGADAATPEQTNTEAPATEQPADTATENTSGQTEDITDACAYQHQEPEGDWYIPDTVPVYTPPESEPAETSR